MFFLNTFPKLDNLGFGGDLEDIVGTAYLAATYLDQIGFDKTKLVYVVGSLGITQELDDVGIKYLPIGVNDLNNPTYPTKTHLPDINFNVCLSSLFSDLLRFQTH